MCILNAMFLALARSGMERTVTESAARELGAQAGDTYVSFALDRIRKQARSARTGSAKAGHWRKSVDSRSSPSLGRKIHARRGKTAKRRPSSVTWKTSLSDRSLPGITSVRMDRLKIRSRSYAPRQSQESVRFRREGEEDTAESSGAGQFAYETDRRNYLARYPASLESG